MQTARIITYHDNYKLLTTILEAAYFKVVIQHQYGTADHQEPPDNNQVPYKV
jgi:hypothetical protein